jgi:hypothetical protein
MYARRTGRNQKKSLEHIGDPPGTILRMLLFHPDDSPFNRFVQLGLGTGSRLGNQSFGATLTIRLDPAHHRVAADTKLLLQHRGAVSLFKIQTYHFNSNFVRVRPTPSFGFTDSALAFVFLFHGLTPFVLIDFYT